MEEDTCPKCGRWNASGIEKQRLQALEHPLYNTDLTQPRSSLIYKARHDIIQIRGMLGDISRAYPGWKESLDNVEGLLNCGLTTLYSIMQDMKTLEDKQNAALQK